jgi:hypothetical protein
MTTRREFLSDIRHRIRFVYLPKHSSWLNQIEIVFGIVHRKCLRGGNFTSVPDLESQLRQFITYYNTTMAHPRASAHFYDDLVNFAVLRPPGRLGLPVLVS